MASGNITVDCTIFFIDSHSLSEIRLRFDELVSLRDEGVYEGDLYRRVNAQNVCQTD